MELPLPLDEFRFNSVLWFLITFYGASGIGNITAFVPGCNEDDMKILKCNHKSNYSFRLTSSLIFFLLGITQFHYVCFAYLTMGEMCLTILVYIFVSIKRWNYLRQNKVKEKELVKKYKKDSKLY